MIKMALANSVIKNRKTKVRASEHDQQTELGFRLRCWSLMNRLTVEGPRCFTLRFVSDASGNPPDDCRRACQDKKSEVNFLWS